MLEKANAPTKQNLDLDLGASTSAPIPNKQPSNSMIETLPDVKMNICRFYKNGKCKYEKDCRFEHPNICKNFIQFGLKKNSEKGCDGNCDLFHPNVCRDSLKTKSCSRSVCRFFHLEGTKQLQPDPMTTGGHRETLTFNSKDEMEEIVITTMMQSPNLSLHKIEA